MRSNDILDRVGFGGSPGSFSAHSIASTPDCADLVEPEVVDLARIVQTIRVDVNRAAGVRRGTPA